jgi:hypothetical protein
VVVQSVLFTVACITINGVDISLYSSWSEWFLKSEAISKELIAEYTPPVLMIISQSLLILRYIFLSLIIFIINLLCKRYPLGVLGAMIVSVVDWLFYEVVYVLTGSYKSLYILPIEHTVLFRIGGFGIENLMNDAERIGVGYSYLYWIVIIATLFYIVYRIVLKKDFMCQEQVR